MTTWVFDRSAAQARFELVDRDRLDLLHRMSTNDVNALQPGEGLSTVLTTALARIIDRLIVYSRGDTALMIANRKDTVRTWLQKHIFLQDKIKIREIPSFHFEIQGEQADRIAEEIAPGASQLPLHHFKETRGGLIARAYPIAAGSGYALISFLQSPPAQESTAVEFGNIVLPLDGLTRGDDARYEQLRIAAGLPGPGHELTEDYIPLEAGLWDSVSFSKGCYIGQEIIARMESRNKLAKTLVALRLDQPVEGGATVSAGAENRTIGTLTSIAALDDGMYAALAFVKPDFADPGTTLTANGVSALVVDAPLIRSRP
ncbi:MAG TPA: hypothetical protein VMT34_08850 [Aggregatilineales bacterium]|nr:hypothetical protein [Aggregatilineales bacterium]